MVNKSILLVGGNLDGQTYTTAEHDTIVRIHDIEIKGTITDVHLEEQAKRRPQGKWYVYEQESEGSERFIFKGEETD